MDTPRIDTQEELKLLYAKRPQVIKPGLERIKKALPYLGGVDKRVPVVIIGGTNGKGTTAGFLWQMLSSAGLTVGLFTSPHLINFSERFCVTGVKTSDDELIAKLQILKKKIPPDIYEDLSFFEVNTLLALQIFSDANTDLNVLEVGLGGRWDSTNACDAELAVITSIGMDHMEFLGNSLEAIAAEKAGIMRSGRSCLWSGAHGTPADKVIRAKALETPAWLYIVDDDYGITPNRKFFYRTNSQPNKFELPSRFWELPKYLRANFVTALAAYCYLFTEKIINSRNPAFTGKADRIADRVLNGNAETPPGLRGRFEFLKLKKPLGGFSTLLLDACHNVDGATTFAEALRERYSSGQLVEPLPALVSILKDKQHAEILDVLRQVCSPVILFPNNSERTWQKEDIAERHRDLIFARDFQDAVVCLKTEPRDAEKMKPLVVCGSVHVMGQVLQEISQFEC
jgi:dihydrofolate synthase/folylpolyglutamate synthase